MEKWFLTYFSQTVGRILMVFLADPHEISISMKWLKFSPIARLRARAGNFCIAILANFVIQFYGGLCFHLGASTSHFQGSISNARGTFELKTTLSSPL